MLIGLLLYRIDGVTDVVRDVQIDDYDGNQWLDANCICDPARLAPASHALNRFGAFNDWRFPRRARHADASAVKRFDANGSQTSRNSL
jgi:hypothetical protein